MMTEDDILIALEIEHERRIESVRRMMREAGRDDLVSELDARLRDIRLGISHARNVWHSISSAQRSVLLDLEAKRTPKVRTWATIRNLAVRGLVSIGGCMLPGDSVELTEHGRFVLAKGQPQLDQAT